MEEVTALKPAVAILDGGATSGKRSGKSVTSLAYGGGKGGKPTLTQIQIQEATKTLHDWLKKENSALRAFLSFMGAGGSFFAASVAEKMGRAYLCEKGGKGDQQSFSKAFEIRLLSGAAVEELDDSSNFR